MAAKNGTYSIKNLYLENITSETYRGRFKPITDALTQNNIIITNIVHNISFRCKEGTNCPGMKRNEVIMYIIY